MLATIRVDWTNERSISRAERRKLKLEDQGYTLISTTGTFYYSILTYKKG